MTPKLFSELGLSPEILKAVAKLGFEQAAPIQAEAIPVLLSGKDVVGQSQTGSGKTAAFAIPAIEKVDPQLRATQILILCPTRELAVQVSEEVHKLAFFKRGVHALPIYGGQSYERQYMGLRQGGHIVIGTPGRVMDHMRRGTLRLEKLKMVILDEADVMLNMGFRDDIETILQDAPKERQTVFFSATMPKPIRDLIEKYSREPQNVRIEQKAMTVPTVEQTYYEVDRRFKIELLTRLIDIHDLKLGIIFCNTKRMVDELVDHLEAQGYSADRLHGDMNQAQRDRVMNKFRKSGLEFLVATDVAARGIDVDDVQVVFNYDLPYDVEDYVHRIGRTGRAGRSGRAISFVAGRELFQIRNIERFTNTRVHRGRVPTADEVDEARENVFIGKIRATLVAGEYKKQDALIGSLLEEGHTSTDIASALLHHLQAGEAAPAKPAKTESYERPERDERPPRPSYQDRPQYQDRQRPERYDSRPRYDDAPPERPRVPISERIVPPKRPASKPAVLIKPPAVSEAEGRAGSPLPAAGRKTADSAHGVTRPTKMESAPIPAKAPMPWKTAASAAPVADASQPSGEKPSRKTPTGQTKLFLNIGSEAGIAPIDVVNSIAGETGLPGKIVGKVDIRERHLFVDVAEEHANAIIAKLNRAEIKGQKVKIKVA